MSPASESGIDLDDAGYVPPDPDEALPVELGRVGAGSRGSSLTPRTVAAAVDHRN